MTSEGKEGPFLGQDLSDTLCQSLTHLRGGLVSNGRIPLQSKEDTRNALDTPGQTRGVPRRGPGGERSLITRKILESQRKEMTGDSDIIGVKFLDVSDYFVFVSLCQGFYIRLRDNVAKVCKINVHEK